MEIVDFEAHFYTKEYVEALIKNKDYPKYKRDREKGIHWLWYAPNTLEPHTGQLLERLLDLNEKRFKDMTEAGVKMQVLSLSAPGCEQFSAPLGTKLAKRVNDELSRIVGKNPDKFVGLAALAPQDPGEAADELERAVKELGLKGWKTHSNIRGTYLDSKKFWIILEKAEKLGVPIFLHPTIPLIRELRKSYGYALAGPAFGFAFDTALCMMRLILSGVFDRYPNLKFVLGHLGEAMPFLLNRLDFPFVRPWVTQGVKIKLSKKPSEYFKNNVFVGTSGEFHNSALICTVQAMGYDKVLFASDYPYEDTIKAVDRINALPLSDEEKAKIFFLNAKTILNLY
ncbi:MAG: amidohydrolase family protein [Nitrososphaerota archaeon]